ncbi:piggyBac transposable element-derived protein 4-like [Eupeodes corollae]|uniref:piggyBac transposable element-derived protein 4-like n=1 Tax=Eupeodes corollae TaxID=290404 RepID=UPI0024933530|nr:piggyBac transposable element-derived protein 4-like [Eupeodes corollae]
MRRRPVATDTMSSDSESDLDFGTDDSNEDPVWHPEENSSEEDENVSDVIRDILLEEEREDMHSDDDDGTRSLHQWSEYVGRHKVFDFVGKKGVQIEISTQASPSDIYSHIVDEALVQFIVDETNRFAEQTIAAKRRSKHARMNQWIPTDSAEIKKFFGLMIWMGLVPLGRMEEYWETKGVYNMALPRTIMSRNRFQVLLSMLHFENNETSSQTNRLRKIEKLIDHLQTNFKALFYPGEDFVIDETLVPWRGRLVFRQYIPNKTHRYGVKLFKLCSTDGYTWALRVYTGKSATGEREVGLAKNVCTELCQGLLNEGRCLFVDNFYTSYELAQSFLQQRTHVVGTLRANKRNLPKEVLLAKLKRGEVISREDNDGIVVLKWKDTRDVRMLSTKHAPVLVPTSNRRSAPVRIQEDSAQPSTSSNPPQATRPRRTTHRLPTKPEAILAYNKGKAGIDLSDQMGSYATTLRKGVKWYRKLGIELLLGTSVVNAWVVYKNVTQTKICIRKFREKLVGELLNMPSSSSRPEQPRTKHHHLKDRLNDSGIKIRRKCSVCYNRITKEKGRVCARKEARQTYTFCEDCPEQPQMCRDCFNQQHK